MGSSLPARRRISRGQASTSLLAMLHSPFQLQEAKFLFNAPRLLATMLALSKCDHIGNACSEAVWLYWSMLVPSCLAVLDYACSKGYLVVLEHACSELSAVLDYACSKGYLVVLEHACSELSGCIGLCLFQRLSGCIGACLFQRLSGCIGAWLF